eukprot:scaffold77783_cov66-Phaeocystis_antarctica.AAC.1
MEDDGGLLVDLAQLVWVALHAPRHIGAHRDGRRGDPGPKAVVLPRQCREVRVVLLGDILDDLSAHQVGPALHVPRVAQLVLPALQLDVVALQEVL